MIVLEALYVSLATIEVAYLKQRRSLMTPLVAVAIFTSTADGKQSDETQAEILFMDELM